MIKKRKYKKRKKKITTKTISNEVEYENENGEHIKDKLKGLEARVFQHEYDHMEGTDFTQKVSRLRLDMAKKKKSKNFKKSKIIQERMSL